MISGIHTVALTVRDQDEALEFYVGALGLEKRLDAPFGEGRWIEVAPAGSATSIALVAREPAAGGLGTAVRLATPDADAAHAELRGRGVDVDAEVLRMGDHAPPMFTLRDPDGNVLVVVQITQ
ncbi:VOC family protein [Pseudonocardia kujensis]|uniref:VOC family protein n=1 Tax=Pseudonocardia kujensis TaxID=1128675 RepID=UPI001E5F0DD3|nr:VOC family protein [Pseudonocardia kujensis]MCE0761686.1 VOC family protein [Pseudonocardia kujensis]